MGGLPVQQHLQGAKQSWVGDQGVVQHVFWGGVLLSWNVCDAWQNAWQVTLHAILHPVTRKHQNAGEGETLTRMSHTSRIVSESGVVQPGLKLP